MRLRETVQGMVVVVLLGVGLALPARADEWVQVASGGLGDSSRRQVDGLAVFGSYVYVAAHEEDGTPRIFRAPIRDDDIWEEITPPGMTGEVTSLRVAVDELLASTTGGQLWRVDATGAWSDVTPSVPGWGAPRPILAVTGWAPRRGGRIVCLARGHLQVWCRNNLAPWAPLPLPGGLGDDATIGSAVLQSYRDVLYLGLGGRTDGSRTCEVWRHVFGEGWQPVTADCFGRPGLTWLLSMAVFEGRLYFGTGGLGNQAVVFRTGGTSLEDVTPCDTYGGCGLFSLAFPIRYQTMARAGARLFLGTRTASPPSMLVGADVLSSDDGRGWDRSNEPGFGVFGNDETSALGSREAYLYAGTVNFPAGAEVWRRTPWLLELYPFLRDDASLFTLRNLGLRACLLSPRPCAPLWEPLRLPLEELRLGFDAARHPQDDPGLIKEARAGLAEVASLVAEAHLFADLAAQAKSEKEARMYEHAAADRLAEAVTLVWSTLRGVAEQLQLVGPAAN